MFLGLNSWWLDWITGAYCEGLADVGLLFVHQRSFLLLGLALTDALDELG